MKNILKLEELAMLVLFTVIYFHLYQGQWGVYAGLFFVPDVAFAGYLISPTLGAAAYNFMHHKGMWIAVALAGWWLGFDPALQAGLIFLAHSSFDRVLGYGLKYPDSFSHTHLGWIGKRVEVDEETEKA